MAKKVPAKKGGGRRAGTTKGQVGRPPRAPSELRNKKLVVPVTATEYAEYREDAGRKTLAEHVRDALERAHEARLERDRQRRNLEG